MIVKIRLLQRMFCYADYKKGVFHIVRRVDVQFMLKHLPANSWKQFSEEFDLWQDEVRFAVERSKRKFYLNCMVELAICLCGDRFDDSLKQRYRNAFRYKHRRYLKAYDKSPRAQLVYPRGRYVYAFDKCCRELKKWIKDLKIF